MTILRTDSITQDFLHTIRGEIASCAQSSYPSLPIASAKNLFFLDSEGAVVEFAGKNGWTVADGRIYFPKAEEMGGAAVVAGEDGGAAVGSLQDAGDLGQQKETIRNMVGYARELEMIV
jgi:26S proteasome regulatory subunit N12